MSFTEIFCIVCVSEFADLSQPQRGLGRCRVCMDRSPGGTKLAGSLVAEEETMSSLERTTAIT